MSSKVGGTKKHKKNKKVRTDSANSGKDRTKKVMQDCGEAKDCLL